jgi:hypothetical protein
MEAAKAQNWAVEPQGRIIYYYCYYYSYYVRLCCYCYIIQEVWTSFISQLNLEYFLRILLCRIKK